MSVNRGTVPRSEAGPYRKYGRSAGRMGRRPLRLRIRPVARVGRTVLTQLEARRHAVGLQVFLWIRGVPAYGLSAAGGSLAGLLVVLVL